MIVTVLVWLAALVIPSGQYARDADGGPIAGTWTPVDSGLSFGERVVQLLRAPVNGVYGIRDLTTGLVDTENTGALFGSIGVVVFILSLGAFLAVVFHTKALEDGVAQLARRMRDRGWLLIVVVMALFALLASAMGCSVGTFGFYALFIPLMAALGYDRMTTAGMVLVSVGWVPLRAPSTRSPSEWPRARRECRSATVSCCA